MRHLRSFVTCLTTIAALASAPTEAQSLKLATTAIADKVATPDQTEIVIDLKEHFRFDGVTGQLVQFDTDQGIFTVEMLANDAPKTVARFLEYVDAGDYDKMIVHRSVPDFVVQTGAYSPEVSGQQLILNPVKNRGKIDNEFKVSNKRGTLAMAKVDGDENSATNNWFVNLADNSAGTPKLDTQNGGFTVFARVIGTGMTVPDEIAKLGVYDLRYYGYPQAFGSTPLETAKQMMYDQFVLIENSNRIATYPSEDEDEDSAIVFSVTNSKPGLATATLEGSNLALSFDDTLLGEGSTEVKVTAKDANNNSVSLSFTLSATPFADIGVEDKAVSHTAGSYEIAVASNVAWTAETENDWISLAPASGEADGAVTLAYEANPGLFERVGQANIGDDTHTVTQAPAKFGDANQTYAQWVEANFPEAERDEILENPATYDGDGDGLPIGFEFALGLDDNDPRSNLSQRIIIDDEGNPYFAISPYDRAIEAELEVTDKLVPGDEDWSAVEDASQREEGDSLWIRIHETDTSFYRARLRLVGVE